MTRDELTDRIRALFPSLGEVEDWRWEETEAGEPIAHRGERSFTGLDNVDALLCGQIPNTTVIGVARIVSTNIVL